MRRRIVVVDDAGTDVAGRAVVVGTIADVVVIARASDMDAEARHPDKGRAVGPIAPHPAIRDHARIPAHVRVVVPGGSQADEDRARIVVVLGKRIPARILRHRVLQIVAVAQIEDRRIALIDEIHVRAVRPAKFEDIEILVVKRNDDGFARGSENLIATLIEDGTIDGDVLADGNIVPVIDALIGRAGDRTASDRRRHRYRLTTGTTP